MPPAFDYNHNVAFLKCENLKKQIVTDSNKQKRGEKLKKKFLVFIMGRDKRKAFQLLWTDPT